MSNQEAERIIEGSLFVASVDTSDIFDVTAEQVEQLENELYQVIEGATE